MNGAVLVAFDVNDGVSWLARPGLHDLGDVHAHRDGVRTAGFLVQQSPQVRTVGILVLTNV